MTSPRRYLRLRSRISSVRPVIALLAALLALGLPACGNSGSLDAGADLATTPDLAQVQADLAGLDFAHAPDLVVVPDLAYDMLVLPCQNYQKDGDETDIDCGGKSCGPCRAGLVCKATTDCQSGVCTNGVCAAPGCGDGVKNGSETDVDCGGGACVPCLPGKSCAAPTDCRSRVCDPGLHQCTSCSDGVRDGDESDIDCGGALCKPCAIGKACGAGPDCADKICTAHVCGVGSCTDGLQNQDETAVDCGGSQCAKCGLMQRCRVDGDCVSGICSGGHLCALVRTLGLSFAAAVSYPADQGAAALVSADLDGDGKLDIAVANQGNDTLSLLLGVGDGSFAAPMQLMLPPFATATAIAAADLNGDKNVDLVVVLEGNDSVAVLLGTGMGRFSPPVQYKTGAGPLGVGIGDLTGDSKPDLVVTSPVDDDIELYIGNGDGTFAPGPKVSFGFNTPTSVIVADVDGDGAVDAASPDQFNDLVLLSLSSTGYTKPLTTATGSSPIGVAFADFNVDLVPDLVTADSGSDSVSLLIGAGKGVYARPVDSGTGSSPSGIAVADFNSDGLPDVVSCNSASNDVGVLLNKGGGVFDTVVSESTGLGPTGVITGDFDADGREDIAVVNNSDGTVSVLLNTSK